MTETRTRQSKAELVESVHDDLEEAARLVMGDRGDAYGHPLDDYTRTGELWAPILRALWDFDGPVPPVAAILCMIAAKISRECHAPNRDNRVDMAHAALRAIEALLEDEMERKKRS